MITIDGNSNKNLFIFYQIVHKSKIEISYSFLWKSRFWNISVVLLGHGQILDVND